MRETDFPALYESADQAAKDAQKHFFRALVGNLACIVISAGMSAANIQTQLFAALQIIPLLGSLGLTIYLAAMQPQRFWYGARALAESVKTVLWRYVMRAEPFNTPDDIARVAFVDSLKKILNANRQISSHAIEMTTNRQITDAMRAIRALPLAERIKLYERGRVEDQHTWYQKKAGTNKRLAGTWFGILICVNVAAIGFALGKVFCPTTNFWPTDVLVAAAGAVLTWLQTKRYQELAASYALTTHEIGLLRAALPTDPTDEQFSVYVGDAENAFSREHTQWQARRDAD